MIGYIEVIPRPVTQNFSVSFYEDRISTLVTNCAYEVNSWISETESIHRRRLHRLIVGLDIEWRPSFTRNVQNRVATLQLCVGRRCLIAQLIHTPYIPSSLSNFLGHASYTFVGVEIQNDADKLLRDYGLRVASMVDLRFLAANELDIRELRNAGLKGLARELLGKTVDKPRSITTGRWDDVWLTTDQVTYACIDAFVSFEIGRYLNAGT